MTLPRRLLDIVLAALLGILLAPVALIVALAIWILDGQPVFYGSLRAREPGRNFRLWKFRTMITDPGDAGVTGGDKAKRITRMGGFLRRSRLDELPQLWNILKGDMSFVGPRPPLPIYVERFPALYAEVLADRPGLTGLATLVFHETEERILAQCQTPEQTEQAYMRRCIPRKARLDLIYAANRSLCSDLMLILATGLGKKWRATLLHGANRRHSDN